MKKVYLLLIVAIVFINCSPDKDFPEKKDYLVSTFKIGNQLNVSHYTHQISIDGKNFRDGGSVTAEESKTSYTIESDATEEFKLSSTLYSRIASVDNNGTIGYSKTIQTIKK